MQSFYHSLNDLHIKLHSLFSFRFKIDKNYVGTPPALEITIGNLNDNIDKAFLADMMNKIGPCEELTIFYHPMTNRHLGFARIVFQDVKHSKLCIEKYSGKSVMGQVSDDFLECYYIIHLDI